MNRVKFPEHPVFSSRRIREVMAARDVDQRWLAGATEYDEATISRFMQGHRPISKKFAVRVADVLEVPLHWLLEEERVPAA